jgi:pyruvate dehydrogenase E1 component alpha subunit
MVKAHGAITYTCDGNDVGDVYQTAKRAYDDVRDGRGPVFIEASTYRWREHCGPNFDNDIGYRTEEEFLNWKEKCPVSRMQKNLLTKNIATQSQLDKIRKEVLADIEDAVDFAKSSPFPPREQLFENLYAE